MMLALSSTDNGAITSFFANLPSINIHKQETDHFPTFQTAKCIFYIDSFRHIVSEEYFSAISTCKEAVEYLGQALFSLQDDIFAFRHLQMACYLKLQDFDNGIALAETIRKSQPSQNSHNYFKSEEMAVLLSFHCGRYNDALAICQKVFDNSALSTLTLDEILMWDCIATYLMCLKQIGMLTTDSMHETIEQSSKRVIYSKGFEDGVSWDNNQITSIFAQIWHALATLHFDQAAAYIRQAGQFNRPFG
ncbi:MAG: hypothetical protein R2795_13685 [Saprospiraceae bacterium]